MTLDILFVEDNPKLRENLKKVFHEETIAGHTLYVHTAETFNEGIEQIKNKAFDIVVLDLQKDADGNGPEDPEAGIRILNAIRESAFVPVVFYTGHAHKVSHLASQIVGVVSKNDGTIALSSEVSRIITSKLALIKQRIYDHIRVSLRDYFWETVHKRKDLFEPIKDDVSVGYLLLRRIANSLSKEHIKTLLGDQKIDPDHVHPMEFYIFPIAQDDTFDLGEIIIENSSQNVYVTLTPSCDMVLRSNGERKAERILLARAVSFSENKDYKKYLALAQLSSKTREQEQQLKNLEGVIRQWIGNNKGDKDRYFFLPRTPFIDNHIVDLQDKTMISYTHLTNDFSRIARLDEPFAQSLLSSFIRYYNRIGFPDIDADYIVRHL